MHRISLLTTNNDFLIEQPGGAVIDTATCRAAYLTQVQREEVAYHQLFGYSPNCVRCVDAARAEEKKLEKEQRILALFLELETCENFMRALEIEEILRGYGVEIVDQREMARMDGYADARREARFGVGL